RRIPIALSMFALLASCSYREERPLLAPKPPRNAAIPGSWLASGTTSRTAETTFRRRVVDVAMSEWRRWGSQALHRRGPKENDRGFRELVSRYWLVAAGRSSRAAWSGAFVSYVLKEAGAEGSWPSTGSHAYYIRWATENRQKRTGHFWARRLSEYAPKPGDLVCNSLVGGVSYDHQPNGSYASHCDIVVDVRPGWIAVIGGNLSNSVAKRALMTDSGGHLINPQPRAFDPSVRNWFAVIETRL
ncbi:MAG: DUF2272 domain-containing protein, partial [Rhodospirillaceae bacterium]|nr:DUF2272 domain-containing protein [Rhodospirillaceae bacterium]